MIESLLFVELGNIYSDPVMDNNGLIFRVILAFDLCIFVFFVFVCVSE